MIVLYREATHSGRGLEQSAIVFPKMAFICSLSSVISTICTFKLEPNDMHTYAVSTYPINTSTVYELHASSLTIHCTCGKFALYCFILYFTNFTTQNSIWECLHTYNTVYTRQWKPFNLFNSIVTSCSLTKYIQTLVLTLYLIYSSFNSKANDVEFQSEHVYFLSSIPIH